MIRQHHCMWVTETFWHWHSLNRSMVSWSWRTSLVMWNTAGMSMMAGWWGGGWGHTASWVFCRGEPEPMPEADRTNQGRAQASFMHANQPARGAGSRASAGVHCHGYSSTHTILPEQVNQVKVMWHPGTGCTRIRDLQLHHRFSELDNSAEWESKNCGVFFFWYLPFLNGLAAMHCQLSHLIN